MKCRNCPHADRYHKLERGPRPCLADGCTCPRLERGAWADVDSEAAGLRDEIEKLHRATLTVDALTCAREAGAIARSLAGALQALERELAYDLEEGDDDADGTVPEHFRGLAPDDRLATAQAPAGGRDALLAERDRLEKQLADNESLSAAINRERNRRKS